MLLRVSDEISDMETNYTIAFRMVTCGTFLPELLKKLREEIFPQLSYAETSKERQRVK